MMGSFHQNFHLRKKFELPLPGGMPPATSRKTMAKKKTPATKAAKKGPKKAEKKAPAAKKAAKKTVVKKKAAPAAKVAKTPAKKAVKAPAKKAAKKRAPKTAKKAAQNRALPSLPGPSFHQISCLAYDIYQRRIHQGLPGDSSTDWQAAEATLRANC